uniref:transposase n=1 Tax=Salinispora pacifica TaxID=351187 RepID=UPI0038CD1331
MDERGIGYIMQVKGDTLAHKPDVRPVERVWSGRGRPPTRTDPRYPKTAVSLTEHIRAAGRRAAETITWRDGSKGTMSSQFVFLRVRPAGHRVARDPDGLLPERWLIAQWPHDEAEPVKYWLSSLPATTSHTDLVRHGKIRWRIEHDYRELKTGLGLPLRRPLLDRLAPPRHPGHRRAPVHHRTTPGPKSGCAGLTLYMIIRELQRLLATWTGAASPATNP